MPKFKVGNVVQLKSGSEKLTVTSVLPQEEGKEDFVTCVWFPVVNVYDMPGSRQRDAYCTDIRSYTFPGSALERVRKEVVEEETED